MSDGSKFASGKYAVAICDRDGKRYPYTEMVVEHDTGMFVHIDNLDEPDPYRRLRSKSDAVALRHPRPDTDLSESLDASVFDS